MDAVIKIGGRLGRGSGLRALCEETAALASRHRLLIVPGGGVFADTVRWCDARIGLSDSAAHWMAILAMDQYGLLLADLIPASSTVRSLDEAWACAAAGRTPVLLPFELVRSTDALPHLWSVTGDSIAAWVAALAGADRLILLKDATGMSHPVPGAGGAEPGSVSLDGLARWETVDGYLPRLVEGADFDLWVLNGERPERLVELMRTGRAEGVLFPRAILSAGSPYPGRPGPRGHPHTRPSGRR